MLSRYRLEARGRQMRWSAALTRGGMLGASECPNPRAVFSGVKMGGEAVHRCPGRQAPPLFPSIAFPRRARSPATCVAAWVRRARTSRTPQNFRFGVGGQKACFRPQCWSIMASRPVFEENDQDASARATCMNMAFLGCSRPQCSKFLSGHDTDWCADQA